jgi:TPP-dependent pyruvate/acetoin dehydrogenase alpha subunit
MVHSREKGARGELEACEVLGRIGLAPYAFLDQAIRDARSGSAPVIVTRSSYKPWLFIMRVDDAVQFAEELLKARGWRAPE